MWVVDSAESFLYMEEAALVLTEVYGIVSLEVHLHEDKPLVMLALDRLEEAAPA